MIHPPGSHLAMTWSQFSSTVMGRRSYKQPFAPDAIPKELIDRCIDLARWAPSAHNAQPWRFMSFYKQGPAHQALRGQLVDAMGSRYASDLARAGTLTAEQVAKASKARNQRFLDAPVLLLAFVDHATLDTYEDPTRTTAEGVMGIQSVAAALQTLLLALHVIGLRACWYCAPLFADSIVYDVLKVPASWHAQAFIAVGKPTTGNAVEQRSDGRMPGTERRPVVEISFEPWQFIDHHGDGAQT